ncbi:hypothetical protein D9756_008707 [Leucocoprinus leucothites]|uniref:6-phosphogluconate dehydrogenase C-terminal domain-like protein n=1 Tax=Leucocoprinus leucothites TaxID=201217 RepID=A0A8H5CYX1_9AGAR|nr:hypothetical protein D9756_008707 [Leucoagaricus leucothites]
MSPTAPTKDVLVVGFGAVGAVYAYILKKSGLAQVTVVARSNYDAINSQGLTLRSKKYGEIVGWKPDRLCKSVADATDKSYSYVFVTTKAIPELTRTTDVLRPLLSSPYADSYPQPTYVVVQNGLNVEKDLYDALVKLGKGAPSIVGTALYILANSLGANIVEHDSFDRLSIGVYRNHDYKTATNSPEEAELLKDLGNILSTGGTTLTIVPEIQRVKFQKNLWNVALSSLATLTGYRLPAVWRPPPVGPTVLAYEPFVSPTTKHLIEEHTLPSLKAIIDEVVALGPLYLVRFIFSGKLTADTRPRYGFSQLTRGHPSSYSDDFMALTKSQYENPLNTHTPSMLLDAQKGLPIEVEVIFGEVVRLAREFNAPVPRVETLYGLLLVTQNQILRKIEASQSP